MIKQLILSFFSIFGSGVLMAQPVLDVQGHRGARGDFPENTTEGFIYSLLLGVNTLEMDVVISKDKQVMVSHEPWMSPVICDLGSQLSDKAAKKQFNMYQMTAEDIQKIDCGLKTNPDFPDQWKIPAVKPKLADVIDQVEQLQTHLGLPPVGYNIEIKSTEDGDGIFHPEPSEFATLLVELLKSKKVLDRSTIQCFEVRTLQFLKQQYPEVKLVYLVGNIQGLKTNLDKLGFTPDIYSPYFRLVDADLVKNCHDMGMKVIPWTVNEKTDMRNLIQIGVDGIISDYPKRLIEVTKEKKEN